MDIWLVAAFLAIMSTATIKFVCKFCVDMSFFFFFFVFSVIYLGVYFPGHMVIILNSLSTCQTVTNRAVPLSTPTGSRWGLGCNTFLPTLLPSTLAVLVRMQFVLFGLQLPSLTAESGTSFLVFAVYLLKRLQNLCPLGCLFFYYEVLWVCYAF